MDEAGRPEAVRFEMHQTVHLMHRRRLQNLEEASPKHPRENLITIASWRSRNFESESETQSSRLSAEWTDIAGSSSRT